MSEIEPSDGSAVNKNLVLIPRRAGCKAAGGISRATEYRRIQKDPDWPRVVDGRYYVLAELEHYLENRIAERDVGDVVAERDAK
jgi:hypothetical protein